MGQRAPAGLSVAGQSMGQRAPTGLSIAGQSMGQQAPTGLSIACLLYTSPSPRDPHVSRMPSSA